MQGTRASKSSETGGKGLKPDATRFLDTIFIGLTSTAHKLLHIAPVPVLCVPSRETP